VTWISRWIRKKKKRKEKEKEKEKRKIGFQEAVKRE